MIAKKIIDFSRSKKSSYWEKVQKKQSLKIFKDAFRKVPGYRDYLSNQGVDGSKIRTHKDFLTLPFTSKVDYLRKYELTKLLKVDNHSGPTIFTSTSGSTGTPFFFLRNETVDWRCSTMMEEFVLNGNDKQLPKTLVLVCFGMGVWIGGLITFSAFELLAKRNKFPISIITPGINKKEILYILKDLLPHYEQLVLAGYPPFIKDVIDDAIREGISFDNKKVKIKFAAEAISEDLREYLSSKIGIKNKYIDTANVYGSADMGAMAIESSTSILVKDILKRERAIAKKVFSRQDKTPTLAQYNPYFINFESDDGNLYITGDNILPLVRYAIGDRGGTFSYAELENLLKDNGIDLKNEAKRRGLQSFVTELPFVYVYERDDLSTTLYGLWIYPEWVKRALLSEQIQQFLTGKFTMITKYDEMQNQYIELNVELKRNANESERLRKLILREVVKCLKMNSSEYVELSNHIKERAYPQVKIWEYEHPLHFQPGIKQRWVKKTSILDHI